MITKERLEELIEQGATIYSNEYGEIQLIKENDLSLYENGKNNYILYALEPNKKYHNEIFDEDLFETKEDAEEYAEFGNITRIEKLTLPSWEEFANGKVVEFVSNKLLYELKKCGERIYISYRTYIDDSIWEIIFEQLLSKENYDEARRLCVKLFKGETDG